MQTEIPPNDTLRRTIYSEEAGAGASFRFGNVTGALPPERLGNTSLGKCNKLGFHFLLLLTITDAEFIRKHTHNSELFTIIVKSRKEHATP